MSATVPELELRKELDQAHATLDKCREIVTAGRAPAVALAQLFVALGLVTADELRGLAAEELQQRRQEVSDTSGKPLSSWLHVADVAADVVLYVMFQGEFVACKVTPANARDLATSLLRAAAHADVAAQRKEPAP